VTKTAKSTCRECGDEVLWRKRADTGGWAPPLNRAGYTMVLDENNRVVSVEHYVRHQCDNEVRQRFQADKAAEAVALDRSIRDSVTDIERRERRREQRENDRIEREANREATYRLAVQVDCPRCPAKEGEECISLNWLNKRTKNPDKYTRWPHPERTILAEMRKKP
jgi:hypothetical protein